MMGRRSEQWSLFYQFRLDERVPKDHLLRRIDRFVTASLADIHERLGPWRRSRKEDAHAEARDNRRGRRSSGSPLHYVLSALPPVTSRRMPGVISFTPLARGPVER